MTKHIKTVAQILIIVFLLTCEQREFVEIAAVKTGQPILIFAHSAILEGNVVDVGGGIHDHGHCWSLFDSPTIDGHRTSLGPVSRTKPYKSDITELLPGTIYYYRSYVITNEVVIYGNSVSFETLSGLATVSTSDISDITAYSAISGGNISDSGEAQVTTRGVCWNQKGEPTISDNKTENGEGSGSFVSVLSGLAPDQTYYVRAYATNSYGTKYAADEKIFSTLNGVATLTTTTVTDITINSAVSGGEITDDGGSAITARGVCWNTIGGPTIADNKTVDGAGIGIFTSHLTGLTENVRYYVRAYATNGVGTWYGVDDMTFVAKDPLVDFDGNQYLTVMIGTQEWMAENLKVTHYPDGTQIPLVSDNYNWAALENNNYDDAYCWYKDDPTTYKDQYGAYYTYAAALNACPAGWHLPTDNEWTDLENYLISNGYNWDGTTSDDKTGKSLAATAGWSSSSEAGDVGNDQGSNNTTGFKALPEGSRSNDEGLFNNVGNWGIWWSSTGGSNVSAYVWALYYSNYHLYNYRAYKSAGFSVRCLKD